MQTFLPYPDFEASVWCLDTPRLNVQFQHTQTILTSLQFGEDYGLASQTWVKAWRGYVPALALYYNQILTEWDRRGYGFKAEPIITSPKFVKIPHWFGNKALHAYHRSVLLRRAQDFYSQYGWQEPLDLAPVFPK